LAGTRNRANLPPVSVLGPVVGGRLKSPLSVLWGGTLAAFRLSPTNPIASPLRGNLHDLPPVLIHASTTEMLLDNSARYTAKAKAEGSPVELHTWQNMVHVWHIFTPLLPEAEEAFEDIREFLKRVESNQH